ncbi:hypothetical protein PCASD_10009 [Puccinia coronata f. sp. avenae]|uniref:Uncharacterized protein n=1 Tax=Puccinia coronata f. sp. avenae TaxID=200324 RepID=A0A2N5UUX6_9BASI|nr:hypothetical protein PCASD_10009 [Puccinia coronata f. sp. avenae]
MSITWWLLGKLGPPTGRPKHTRKIPGRARPGQTPPNQDPTQTRLPNGLPVGHPWAACGPGAHGAHGLPVGSHGTCPPVVNADLDATKVMVCQLPATVDDGTSSS